MRPFSLRTRLTLYYSLILAILLAGFGFLAYRSLTLRLEQSSNEELDERAAALKGFLRFRNGQLSLVFNANDPEEAYFVHNATKFYQAFDLRSGELVAQSRDLELLGIQPSPSEVRNLAQNLKPADIETTQGVIRFHQGVFHAGPKQAFLIRVGISLQAARMASNEFLRGLLVLIPVGVLLVALGGWQMARSALRPIRDLARAARRIDIERLNERLPLRGTRDELDQLAQAFNHTLARLEDAVGQMRQFTASVSHELRTPLTAMRGEAEVALLEAQSVENYRRVLASQLEELDRLTQMINQLLTLARAEAGEIRLGENPVDLSELVASLGEQMEPVAASSQIKLQVQPAESIVIRGDAEWLERVVLNLLDNAIKFTQEGGRIEVSMAAEGQDAVLRVSDTGIGIPTEAQPHIFERFYRAEPSRSKQVEGVGLGLALVKWIVDRHRGRIEVESRAGEGSCFTVRLPLAGTAGRPSMTNSSATVLPTSPL